MHIPQNTLFAELPTLQEAISTLTSAVAHHDCNYDLRPDLLDKFSHFKYEFFHPLNAHIN